MKAILQTTLATSQICSLPMINLFRTWTEETVLLITRIKTDRVPEWVEGLISQLLMFNSYRDLVHTSQNLRLISQINSYHLYSLKWEDIQLFLDRKLHKMQKGLYLCNNNKLKLISSIILILHIQLPALRLWHL